MQRQGDERLRIVQAIFTRNFWGSERAAVELANHLSQRHDVTLMVRDDCDRNAQMSIVDRAADTVRIVRIPSNFKSLHILRHVLHLRPHIFHSHLGRAARLSGLILPWVPKVATLHVWTVKHYKRQDALICISDWQHGALPPSMRRRARVIRNWVVPHKRLSDEQKVRLYEECGLSRDDYVVGFVGRLSKGKGTDVALDGFRKANLANAKFVLFGTGDLESWVRGIRDPRIKLVGYRPNVKDYYQIMNVVLVPSPYEYFGLTLVEAMAAGCHVIACRSAGPKDILESQDNGFLIEPGDVQGLSNALWEAHDRRHQPHFYDMAPFSIDDRVADIEQLYVDLLSKKAKKPKTSLLEHWRRYRA